jgi:hypothetical protein
MPFILDAVFVRKWIDGIETEFCYAAYNGLQLVMVLWKEI